MQGRKSCSQAQQILYCKMKKESFFFNFMEKLHNQVDFFWTASSLRAAFPTSHRISLVLQSHPVQHPSHISYTTLYKTYLSALPPPL